MWNPGTLHEVSTSDQATACCALNIFLHFLCYADELLLQEDLVQMVPMVNEANAMAEELGKKVINSELISYDKTAVGTYPFLRL